MCKSILQLKNVGIGYDSANIVTDISLHINTGERVALVGQNGVGKTTLLQAIMGMTPQVTGDIICYDKQTKIRLNNLTTQNIAKQQIALVKQEHAIFADLSIAEHFLALPKALHAPLGTHLQYFPDLLPKKKTLGKQLSGGQRQQLAIALALATQPKLLLLDEPSANIQPSVVESMINTLITVSEQNNMALLISEQNLHVINKLTTRGYSISAGKLTAYNDDIDQQQGAPS